MQPALQYIKKELTTIYPAAEVTGIISLIFRHLKNYTPTDLVVKQDEQLSRSERETIEQIVNRLKNNEPIQYILRETHFYGYTFKTPPGVLIPRPETEELVDWILKENHVDNPFVLDIGTGTGCIAISLKKGIEKATVYATDISDTALQTARENAWRNSVDIQLLKHDILAGPYFPVEQTFDLIVSNPPYVTPSDKKLMHNNVLNYEPPEALFVTDDDPLCFYRAIAGFAKEYLKPDGTIFFEINEQFGSKVAELLKSNGFQSIQIKKDLNGKDRMVKAV